MTNFLKSLLGNQGKSTHVADDAVETAKLKLDARVNHMLAHHNQNEQPKAKADVAPLAG